MQMTNSKKIKEKVEDMASSGSPDSVSSAENLLRKESNEMSDLFSKKTIEKLESIPEGSAVAAAKGD